MSSSPCSQCSQSCVIAKQKNHKQSRRRSINRLTFLIRCISGKLSRDKLVQKMLEISPNPLLIYMLLSLIHSLTYFEPSWRYSTATETGTLTWRSWRRWRPCWARCWRRRRLRSSWQRLTRKEHYRSFKKYSNILYTGWKRKVGLRRICENASSILNIHSIDISTLFTILLWKCYINLRIRIYLQPFTRKPLQLIPLWLVGIGISISI